jgi:hypothetical protein
MKKLLLIAVALVLCSQLAPAQGGTAASWQYFDTVATTWIQVAPKWLGSKPYFCQILADTILSGSGKLWVGQKVSNHAYVSGGTVIDTTTSTNGVGKAKMVRTYINSAYSSGLIIEKCWADTLWIKMADGSAVIQVHTEF